MDKKIEAAIRETLVIGNPVSVKRCVDKLKLIFEQEQALRQANVMLSLPTLQEVEDAVKTYSNGTTDNERDKKLISDAYRIGAYWAINTICRGNGA